MRRVGARVEREGAELDVSFVLEGDLSALAIPAPGATRPGERLWEHTCFEVFVAAGGTTAYHELNVAPSGAWQAHAFTRYREGGPLADDTTAPRIAVERDAARLTVAVRVAIGRWSPAYATAGLRVGVAAVVEDTRGGLSYWAVLHPPGRPDFHHRDGFAVAVPEAASGSAVR